MLLEFCTIATISVFKPVCILFFKKVLDSEFTMISKRVCSSLLWVGWPQVFFQTRNQASIALIVSSCKNTCWDNAAPLQLCGGNWMSLCLSGAYSMQLNRALKEWCLQVWSRCYISPYSWFSSWIWDYRERLGIQVLVYDPFGNFRHSLFFSHSLFPMLPVWKHLAQHHEPFLFPGICSRQGISYAHSTLFVLPYQRPLVITFLLLMTSTD